MTETTVFKDNIMILRDEMKRGNASLIEEQLPVLYEFILVEHPDCLEIAIETYHRKHNLNIPHLKKDLRLIEAFRPVNRWSIGEKLYEDEIKETLDILNTAIGKIEAK